ncbi:hypothetical protein ZHAS_00009570 [Anopheles sinensis]|uniref:Uncharacterized protein n=1 Tax=Anopheles sinensis TaxID=74873 RepID=A0A084VVK0_ANOSI|nr:hypothetical protein ZHAS_00009570 [Anopheles sinensis]
MVPHLTTASFCSDSVEQNVVPIADSSDGSGAGQLRDESPEASNSIESGPANATANANEALNETGRPSMDIPLAVPAVAEDLNDHQPVVAAGAGAMEGGPVGLSFNHRTIRLRIRKL